MCSFLVEKGPNLGKKYDTKGLFLHSVATYFEEESDKCKSQLESLIKILCIRHGEKEKMESALHHLVSQFSTFFFYQKKEPSTGIPEINLTNPRDADLTTF